MTKGLYRGHILDTFNFSAEGVQVTLPHLTYKSTGPDTLHPQILSKRTTYWISDAHI